MAFVLLLVVVAVAAFLMTAWLRRYALAKSLLDIPNGRSSHAMPTPRGGGLAVVIGFLLALPVLQGFGGGSNELLWALLGAGGWVALVGFLDDHRHVPARWRLLAHFTGAAWALICLGGLPPLTVWIELDLGWAGHVLAMFYLVWLVNLFNFMDGIDGIAGIEVVTVCTGASVLFHAGGDSAGWAEPAVLAASTMGFLAWNFPKAKIFMGDAGSGFLGMIVGIFSIHAAWIRPELFWGWIILLGVFIIDATVTLLRRVANGERFYEAHRSHAYQHASRLYADHTKVSLAVGTINLLWLLPIAILVTKLRWDPLIGLLVAYAPLLWLAFRFNAGKKEQQA